jgi:hypothetical protein
MTLIWRAKTGVDAVVKRLRGLGQSLSQGVKREQRLWQQQREIEALRAELEKLRFQNERMAKGMRRCVTCEYRLEVVGKR